MTGRCSNSSTRSGAFPTSGPWPRRHIFRRRCGPTRRKGLGWLQFLRRHGLGGILADRHGPGKEQCRHWLTSSSEKQQNRLYKPSLIVAPVSVLGNWQQEIRRFAPDSNCSVLHGPKRKEFVRGHRLGRHRHHRLSPIAARQPDAAGAGVLFRHPRRGTDDQESAGESIAGGTGAAGGAPAVFDGNGPWRIIWENCGRCSISCSPACWASGGNLNVTTAPPSRTAATAGARPRSSNAFSPFLLRRTKDAVARDLPPKIEIVEPIELDEKTA